MDETKNPVWIAVWPTLLLVGFGLACGAGGATFGENAPGNAQYGGGTYLDDATVTPDTPEGVGENGSLGVDPDTEYTYTQQVRMLDGEAEKRLVVVPPNGTPREVMDLTDFEDVRILFPPESVLVMAQPIESEENVDSGLCRRPNRSSKSGCGDHLFWFDKLARQKLRQLETDSLYHGTRLSPKRNYLAVADNFTDGDNIHLLNTNTGETNVVPNPVGWYEGMWLHDEDVLVTAGFETTSHDDATVRFLRIREWSPRNGDEQADLSSSTCFFEEGEQPPEGCDVMIPGVTALYCNTFSWISVSRDDRWVAVPAERSEGQPVLVLVDRELNEIHTIEDTWGPVGFTPDSKSVVGFGFASREGADAFGHGREPHLTIIDLGTMEATHEPTPGDQAPTFFVSNDSVDIVVANAGTGEAMMIVDLEAGTAEQMPGPNVAARGRQVDLGELRSEYELDRRTISANNLVRDQAIVNVVDTCDERTCHTGENMDVGLTEFVSRTGEQELWLIESTGFLRIDLERGYAESIPIDPLPKHINILPNRDLLVIDSPQQMQIRFFDPSTRRISHVESIALGWGAR